MFSIFKKNQKEPKISVITWDASFRESFHTVDSFGNQDYPRERYEFIWVDFYTNNNPALLEKIDRYPNCRILNLGNHESTPWHLGKCINAGIKEAKGEILVIPDGDVVVGKNLLGVVKGEHERQQDLVMYFRRWDESAEVHDEQKSPDIDYLERVCELTNPTNYGGLISLRRETLAKVNFYEENDIFAGPGANGLELYIRVRNRGLAIKWHQDKIYHPFHANTGKSATDRAQMELLAKKHLWINPYCGINQSWVIKSREMDLSYLANDGYIEKSLGMLPAEIRGLEN